MLASRPPIKASKTIQGVCETAATHRSNDDGSFHWTMVRVAGSIASRASRRYGETGTSAAVRTFVLTFTDIEDGGAASDNNGTSPADTGALPLWMSLTARQARQRICPGGSSCCSPESPNSSPHKRHTPLRGTGVRWRLPSLMARLQNQEPVGLPWLSTGKSGRYAVVPAEALVRDNVADERPEAFHSSKPRSLNSLGSEKPRSPRSPTPPAPRSHGWQPSWSSPRPWCSPGPRR